MKRFVIAFAVCFVFIICGCSSADVCRCSSVDDSVKAARDLPIPDVSPTDTAVVPVSRPDRDGWMPRHEKLLANVRYNQKIVFIGDSITHLYEGVTGTPSWTLMSSQYSNKLTNLGIGGDQTQHVIWRLQNGEFPTGINPEYVVLLIGTNNRQGPESIAAGIGKIIQTINAASPSTKIILMGIFPRGTGIDDENTVRNYAVNNIIKNYHGYLNVIWLDIGQYYLNQDGSLKTDLFTDNLHLSQAGYEIWREKLMGLIKNASVKSGGGVPAAPAALPPVPPPATTAAPPASIGVIFEWDSAKTPISGNIRLGNPVSTGYGNINFNARNNISTRDGAIRMEPNNLLLIGGVANQNTDSGKHIPGIFNISQGAYRVTIDYKDPEEGDDIASGGYLLRFSINNNHNSQVESVLGINSNLGQFSTINQLRSGRPGSGFKPGTFINAERDRLIWTINPQVTYANISEANRRSLETAFFSINCQKARITITGIKIERIE